MTGTLSGTWKLSVTVGSKSGVATFQFAESDDGTLSGTYTGQLGSAQVAGMKNGDEFEFWFEWHAGQVRYKGTCVEDEMSGTCIYGSVGNGEFNGTRVSG